jgi:hypothetical protein
VGDFAPLQPVWAKMVGYKPTWTPAIISYIYPTQSVDGSTTENTAVVFFLESFVASSSSEENTPPPYLGNRILPSWFIEEQDMRIVPSDQPGPSVQRTFLNPSTCLKPWNGPHKETYLKQVHAVGGGKKLSSLLSAVELGDRISETDKAVPVYVIKDKKNRESILAHSQNGLQIMSKSVLPQLKLHHLKLFLETNMVELHWRCIGYARQFVKAVPDEIFGGFHLIAAQDWPTDKDLEKGIPEVCLIYPGQVLSGDEARELENACKSGIHEDRNRYVAEMPNTAVIYDKTGKINVNTTGKNLFVDGFKYADPLSPIWAPGPTVNHERVKYCKLAPHHVVGTSDSMRGFWLQRKKGEIITKGEPLFWSYDCGAGKFDKDYGLTNSTPPPIGWRSTEDIIKERAARGIKS